MEHAPTPSQTIGPFFHLCLTADAGLGCLAGPMASGERIQLAIRVLDGDGVAVNDAMVELWQADAAGKYNHPEDRRHGSADPGFPGFGRLCTGENGVCEFETIKPGRVPGRDGTYQAPHVNVSLFARGLLKQLVTRIYFSGDPANQTDPALAVVPEDRRRTLLAHPCPQRPGAWDFEIRLAGAGETVFFEI